MSANPEIGRSIAANGITTNYHDAGRGDVVLLLHGSGPGVSAWANWRLVIPVLAERFRVLAPDAVGFGYTERPAGMRYDLDAWVAHAAGLLDALDIGRAHVIGNSFGGSLALALAIRQPARVRRLVLMGSVGVEFELTPGLDKTWGYTPSLGNMRELLDIFAYDRRLVSDELARLRYEASIQPGFQESFAAMFPAPRQDGIRRLASPEQDIRRISQPTLIVHGREDRVIPPATSLRLFELIPNAELHMFGHCGHWTQIEHTARFNRLVGDFLAPGEP
ncbi:MAG: alpha/beta fold hydrolase [Gammaproteobacteria bacterium]|nr:alpha/beta fold hydrolase [Gammaproteobacteria bacterium]